MYSISAHVRCVLEKHGCSAVAGWSVLKMSSSEVRLVGRFSTAHAYCCFSGCWFFQLLSKGCWHPWSFLWIYLLLLFVLFLLHTFWSSSVRRTTVEILCLLDGLIVLVPEVVSFIPGNMVWSGISFILPLCQLFWSVSWNSLSTLGFLSYSDFCIWSALLSGSI